MASYHGVLFEHWMLLVVLVQRIVKAYNSSMSAIVNKILVSAVSASSTWNTPYVSDDSS